MTLIEFAQLRHKIWLRKSYGYDLPTEESAVLDQHHYTNIWRELDRNSVYLFNTVQHVGLMSFEATVLNTIRFRLFNKIETNEALMAEFGSLATAFEDGQQLHKFLAGRQSNFTGAYVRCPDLKQLCELTSNQHLVPVAKAIAWALTGFTEDQEPAPRANDAWKAIRSIFSIGDFLADQLLMDLTWVGGPFEDFAGDVSNFFTPKPGPGARAGLKHCEQTGQGSWDQLLETVGAAMAELPMPTVQGVKIKFDERALEHTLCEYFKHVKFEGRNGAQVKMRKFDSNRPDRLPVAVLPHTWTAPQLGDH